MKNPILIVCMLLSASFFPSCEKEQANVKSPQRKAIIHVNTSNPYDSYGHDHNAIMDDIAADLSFPSQSSSDIYDIAQAYALANRASTSLFSVGTFTGIYGDIFDDYADSKNDVVAMTVADVFDRAEPLCSLSTAGAYYFGQLEEKFNDAAEATISVSTFLSDLVSIESTISTDLALTTDEKNKLLVTFAIARNSVAYWDDVANDTEHPWNGAFTDGLDEPASITFFTILIGACDALGGISSYQAGKNAGHRGGRLFMDTLVGAGVCSGMMALGIFLP
jgi:hypothetical protein